MKYDSLFSMKMILGVLITVTTVLSGFLVVEHGNLKQQMNRVVSLQDEYHTYTIVFQEVLREYRRMKGIDGERPSILRDAEKKKEAIIESSCPEEQPFLLVNREPDYLKSSLVEYAKERNMNNVLKSLYKKGTKKRTRSKRRRRRKDSSLLSRQLRTKKTKQRQRDIDFCWPVDHSKFWISSFFGARRNLNRSWGFHSGVDMAALKGTPVYAAADGLVVEAGANKGYGNTIVIMHNKKYKTRYAHLKNIYCKHGDRVKKGKRIASVGDTGLVRKKGTSASHLHFEVYSHGKQINPLYFFS